MAATTSARGKCCVCGREYTPTKAGFLPRYWAWDENDQAAASLPDSPGAGIGPTRLPAIPKES